jgi:DNA polymerase-3 subunit epsilon
METVAVIDFETTGLSSAHGERATEVAAVLVRDGRIVDRYQSLMNTGRRIPSFIEKLTGISNSMVDSAPPAATVMNEVAEFVGGYPLVAHNASFDRKFWDAELERAGGKRSQQFICSMLVARRLLPGAPNHKLGTLIDFAGLPVAGRYHRALADAEMTASLLTYLEGELIQRFRVKDVSSDLLQRIQKVPKSQLKACVVKYEKQQRH